MGRAKRRPWASGPAPRPRSGVLRRGGPVDLDTVTVINDWHVVHIGHRDHAERELALAIAERHRAQRRSHTQPRRAA